MSVEFETPAARVIKQFSGKDSEQFKIPVDLPDITFLRALSVQGRLRYFQEDDLEANPITITPPTGETFFFYRAEFSNNSAVLSNVTMVNDGSTRWSQRLLAGTIGEGQYITEFIDSLVGNGVKSLVFDATDAASLIDTSVFGWVENTSRIRDVNI